MGLRRIRDCNTELAGDLELRRGAKPARWVAGQIESTGARLEPQRARGMKHRHRALAIGDACARRSREGTGRAQPR